MDIGKFERFIWVIAILAAVIWLSVSDVLNNDGVRDYGGFLILPSILFLWLHVKAESQRAMAAMLFCYAIVLSALSIWISKTAFGAWL